MAIDQADAERALARDILCRRGVETLFDEELGRNVEDHRVPALTPLARPLLAGLNGGLFLHAGSCLRHCVGSSFELSGFAPNKKTSRLRMRRYARPEHRPSCNR